MKRLLIFLIVGVMFFPSCQTIGQNKVSHNNDTELRRDPPPKNITIKDFIWPDGTKGDFGLLLKIDNIDGEIKSFMLFVEGGYRFCGPKHAYTCIIDFEGVLKRASFFEDKEEYYLSDFEGFKITIDGSGHGEGFERKLKKRLKKQEIEKKKSNE